MRKVCSYFLIKIQRKIVPNYDVTKTIVSPFMDLLEVRMITEWTNYGKHQNDKLRSLSYKASASLWWGRKYLNPSSFICKHWTNSLCIIFICPLDVALLTGTVSISGVWLSWRGRVTLYHQLTFHHYKRGQNQTWWHWHCWHCPWKRCYFQESS